MKKVSATLVFTLIIGVSALAYGKSKPLADQQMDRISAGSAIANGESSATDSRSSEVELTDNAQNFASGVNIVNASGSVVADGVNVWNGNKLNNAVVAQANSITQLSTSGGAGATASASASAPEGETEADAATGDAIALDGSSATVRRDDSVELSDSAQAHAKATNIVNAAGSLVANGVNVASSTNLNNLTLAQANSISQTTH